MWRICSKCLTASHVEGPFSEHTCFCPAVAFEYTEDEIADYSDSLDELCECFNDLGLRDRTIVAFFAKGGIIV